ncbi:hypothetical protein WICMUC_001136 [Wickerhamomyces mucosus]|uniref:TATA element modulatory factor 1 TATA binding domain-containing protein n=1 Tax=Wickerhamomyces mucosus TaxID=1378264 RepID=A0A9P8PVU4_9ASCO|nr:hypothetical protein WICMUC_001136 [Wickerhamomyces mucosus]
MAKKKSNKANKQSITTSSSESTVNKNLNPVVQDSKEIDSLRNGIDIGKVDTAAAVIGDLQSEKAEETKAEELKVQEKKIEETNEEIKKEEIKDEEIKEEIIAEELKAEEIKDRELKSEQLIDDEIKEVDVLKNKELNNASQTLKESSSESLKIDSSHSSEPLSKPIISTQGDDIEATTFVTDSEPEKIQEETPSLSLPRKRLTLQERLALAAKSKGKKRVSSSPITVASNASSRSASPEAINALNKQAIELNPSPLIDGLVKSLGEEEKEKPAEVELIPQNFKNLPNDQLYELVNQVRLELLALKNKNNTLKVEKLSLQEKIKNLGEPSSARNASPHQFKDKDAKIQQLLNEGEELSKRELKANNLIKKLKSKESDQEFEIKTLSNSLDLLETEKKQLKDSLKKSQDSEKQSSIRIKSLQAQLDNQIQSNKDEISRNQQLSANIEELSQAIITEKSKHSKEIHEFDRKLDKSQIKLETASEEHDLEVKRLEEKIEQLRFQSENAQTLSNSNESYLKLTRQYDTLQIQYTSATENWQSIEASLMNKINNYEVEIDQLKSKIKASETKILLLSNDLNFKIIEFDDLLNSKKKLSNDFSKLEIKLSTLSDSLNESEDQLQQNHIKFTQEKSILENKISNLEKQIRDQIQPHHLYINESSLSFNSPSISLHHGNSSVTSLKSTQQRWDTVPRDIGFGESSTTPLTSRKPSAYFIPNASFDENDDDSDFENGNNTTPKAPQSPVSQYIQTGSHISKTHENNSSSLIGSSNAQLLGKMSNQVRRLEAELSSMNEDLERLENEKKQANEEIVRLMKDNENVDAYKSRIKELEEDVESYSRRHEQMLEILGEKSEQVEELKADVQDLKDLCKLQVQQLVEIQTS